MTPTGKHTITSDMEFNVDTEMKDVEIFHVSSSRVLAKGKRFGRLWLLRALPPEKRHSRDSLREFCKEFDRSYDRVLPESPLTVGMEEIAGLGPCIVEEWSDDRAETFSRHDDGRECVQKKKLRLGKTIFVIGLLVALVGIVWGGLYVWNLTSSYSIAKINLETLRLVNRAGGERIAQLADSLDIALRKPLIPENYDDMAEIREMDSEEKISWGLYQIKMKEFEKELARYDRHVIPQVKDSLPVFYDSLASLFRKMIIVGNTMVSDKRYLQLPEDDRIRLIGTLHEGYMKRIQNYTRKWIPEAVKAEKDKNNKTDQDKEPGNE